MTFVQSGTYSCYGASDFEDTSRKRFFAFSDILITIRNVQTNQEIPLGRDMESRRQEAGDLPEISQETKDQQSADTSQGDLCSLMDYWDDNTASVVYC